MIRGIYCPYSSPTLSDLCLSFFFDSGKSFQPSPLMEEDSSPRRRRFMLMTLMLIAVCGLGILIGALITCKLCNIFARVHIRRVFPASRRVFLDRTSARAYSRTAALDCYLHNDIFIAASFFLKQ